jgi:hypothetical protein
VGGGGEVPILDYISPTSSKLNPLVDLQLYCYCDASLTYHADMWVMVDDKRYEYVSWSQQLLEISIPKADLAVSGIRQVRVCDANGESPPQSFTVEAADPLALTSYSPNPIAASYAGGVTVTGTGFDPTTEFYLDGGAFDPSWVVINTSIRATLTAPSAWVAGDHVLTAYSDSLGQNSNELPVTVAAAPVAPTLTALTPNSVTAGSSDASIVIDGTNFDASSVVMLNGETPLTPTAIGATQLTFTLPANWMINPATFQMSVITAAGTSNALPLTVAAAVANPTITSISPDTVPVGSLDTQITVTGTNFDATCGVLLTDIAVASVFVNATTMTATIPAANFQYQGSTMPVKVTKPGATTSNAVNLVVGPAAPTGPVITSTIPAACLVGETPSVSVMGTGFMSSSVVYLDGAQQATTFIDSTLIQFFMPAASTAAADVIDVTVSNDSGATHSSPGSFTVTAAAARGKKKR